MMEKRFVVSFWASISTGLACTFTTKNYIPHFSSRFEAYEHVCTLNTFEFSGIRNLSVWPNRKGTRFCMFTCARSSPVDCAIVQLSNDRLLQGSVVLGPDSATQSFKPLYNTHHAYKTYVKPKPEWADWIIGTKGLLAFGDLHQLLRKEKMEGVEGLNKCRWLKCSSVHSFPLASSPQAVMRPRGRYQGLFTQLKESFRLFDCWPLFSACVGKNSAEKKPLRTCVAINKMLKTPAIANCCWRNDFGCIDGYIKMWFYCTLNFWIIFLL